MNLTTHFFFALAVGFFFIGQPALALLVALGALLPDLDREYWFMKPQQYRDEQLHRSLFHNFFVMAGVFLVSPFVALGMFLHTLQDALTTVKDRGCEWLYPATRFVKLGAKNYEGKDEQKDPKEHIYFYQEDSKGLLENADPDLRIVGDKHVPWRRTYGPALNGQLLDTGFLVGSIALIVLWLVLPVAHANAVTSFLGKSWVACVLGFGSVALVFAAGEVDRHFAATTQHKTFLDASKYVLFACGLFVGGYGIAFYRDVIYSNIVGNDWFSILVGVVIVAIVGLVVVTFNTRNRENAIV